MRKLLIYVLPAVMLMMGDLAAREVQHRFSLPLQEDGRQWYIGYGVHDEESFVEVYVLQGKTLENSEEIFGVQGFDSDATPERYFDEMLKALKEEFAGGNVQHKIIEQDEQGMIAEWWGNSDEGGRVYEIFRMARTPAGQQLVVYYQTSQGQVSEEKHASILKMLRNAQMIRSESD